VGSGCYDRRARPVRDLQSDDTRVYLGFEVRRVQRKSCGRVKPEWLDFLADNPFRGKRLARHVGRRCRQGTVKDSAMSSTDHFRT
jgi:hypothetical protein